MMTIMQAIRDSVNDNLPHVRELRHELHQIPEVGLSEHKTSRLLHTELVEAGYKVQSRFGVTGLVADLKTGRDGGYVILRADMDGLPVKDRSMASYHSQHEGVCHCCGHDGHAATLLGVARVLRQVQAGLRGRVKFIFQPAEEIAKGALAMIEDGLLCRGPADAIFALHAWPGLAVDSVACRPGAVMAASDAFQITVYGQGGHGARPSLAKNPLTAIVQIVPKLQDMTNSTRVVSPCVANVGDKMNVIAETGVVSGTIRTLNPDDRESTMLEVSELVMAEAENVGMRAEVQFDSGCPAVHNDPKLYDLFREVGSAILGAERVNEQDEPSMGSEDFGYFLNHMPGLMFRLGMGEQASELHNPRFNFNDDALETGILMMAGLAVRVCNGSLND